MIRLKVGTSTQRFVQRLFLFQLVFVIFFLGLIGQASKLQSFLVVPTNADAPSLISSNQQENLDEYGYMAACLFVNDENHRLPEWIAYHYYVVGLRRIIITNTPHSTSTPRPILDRWKDRINITLWNEHGPTDFPLLNSGFSNEETVANQLTFIARCHQSLKKEGWNMSFHIDPDEYFVVNHRVRGEPDHFMYNMGMSLDNFTIPPQREASSIPKLLKLLEPFRNDTSKSFLHSSPCMQYARLQFSNKPTLSTDSTVLETYANVSKGIDIGNLNTFRWLWEGGAFIHGKGIAELSRLSYSDIEKYKNVHLAVGNKHRCTPRASMISVEWSPLLIHHYPSSWPELMARTNTPFSLKYATKEEGDKEKNMTELLARRYKIESKSNGKMVLGIQDWLPGFIDFVGRSEAERLLQHVGKPALAKLGAEVTWG